MTWSVPIVVLPNRNLGPRASGCRLTSPDSSTLVLLFPSTPPRQVGVSPVTRDQFGPEPPIVSSPGAGPGPRPRRQGSCPPQLSLRRPVTPGPPGVGRRRKGRPADRHRPDPGHKYLRSPPHPPPTLCRPGTLPGFTSLSRETGWGRLETPGVPEEGADLSPLASIEGRDLLTGPPNPAEDGPSSARILGEAGCS